MTDEPAAPTRDLPVPGRVLAIGAHADDIELNCGGTLAKWAAAGSHVELCVLTDGSKGTWNRDEDIAALVAHRQDEQRDAAEAVGAAEVHFLAYPDGELESSLAERAAVCEVIRRSRPDVVLGHDPWKRYRLHPDHFHAGRLTVDGIVAARDHHFFPGHGGEPHRPETLLLFEADVVDHVEDITGHLDTKIQALLCHRSQWLSTLGIDPETPDLDAFAARIHTQPTESYKRIEPL